VKESVFICGLLGAAIAFSSLSATAQVPLSPQESRGKEIYLLGTSKSGRNILAYMGDESMEVPGSAMPCANCHGLSGQGKPEGGIEPSNITWEALTKPYGVTHSSGRKHPPYTARALEFAITRGLDPGGNRLQYAMPRYQMSKEDLDDLVLYLKRLGTDVDAGISEEKIVIGTALPASGPLADMGQAVKDVITAYFAEVNSQGGIYNRRIELKFTETGANAATTRANIERLIKDEKVFAMTSVFLAGAEKEVLPALAQLETPVIGPMTLFPQPGSPLNRQVFYLLSGNTGQAQALVSFMLRKTDEKDGITVLYQMSDLNSGILDAIKTQMEKDARKAPKIYAYTDSLDAPEYVKQMRRDGAPPVIFFLGSAQDLTSFMQEAAKVNWFPQILLQGGGVSASIFDAPAGFDGKIFFTLPTSPTDQKPDALMEFKALMEKYKLSQKHLAAQVTAYSGAKVLVEALKRAGKELSREKLIQSLEGIYQYSTGLTPQISYGPNRRIGATGAYIVVLDLKEKKFVPAAGWVEINQ
jgi:ABC-type branched-subunit amino acid transport system substrate-binding protein